MLRFLDFLYTISSPAMKRSIVRTWYRYFYQHLENVDITCMNYGFIDLKEDAQNLELSHVGEIDRYGVQLYHHVASAVDLSGLDVLEVGCGRGGGAAYLMRSLRPRTMAGVDMSRDALAFCQRRHSLEGLSFTQGDAEALPWKDHSFDVVVNIESSHCYGSMERFLREVFRVLRPNGYFLFADLRERDQVACLRRQLRDSALQIINEQSIRPNILGALDLNNELKQKFITQKSPKLLKKRVQQFAAMQGTTTYDAFKSGELDYLSFVLHKSGVNRWIP